MPTILRANDSLRSVQAPAFNFDDLAAQANRYLEKVRGEAAKIVAQAQQEAAAIRRQAEADGRQAALASVEKVIAAQLGGVLAALRQAVQEIGDAKQAWLRHWEGSAVHVAALMAKRVIRRELQTQPDVPLALVREALELAAGSSQLRIHLNPADHERIAGQVQALAAELAGLATAEIVADPAVGPGGCRVETKFGVIDQQIESQLARIEEELT
jgi:flagellar assembly protein FliH